MVIAKHLWNVIAQKFKKKDIVKQQDCMRIMAKDEEVTCQAETKPSFWNVWHDSNAALTLD